MAANHRDVRIFPGRSDFYVQKMRSIVSSGLGFTYLGENYYSNAIVFTLKNNVSLSSWGEQISVTLTPQGDNTLIDVYSECSLPTQVVDWGKNKENTSKIIMYLSNPQYQQGYAQPQQGYAQQQQGYAQPQQSYAQQQQSYAQPQQSYAQPQQGYAQPQQSYAQQNNQQQKQVNCPYCSGVIKPTDNFCTNCGTRVK